MKYATLILICLFIITGCGSDTDNDIPFPCTTIQQVELDDDLLYMNQTCNFHLPTEETNNQLLTTQVHIVSASLDRYYLKPIVNALYNQRQLQSLLDIASSSDQADKIVAGVNGGFFDMATVSDPIDNMCNLTGPDVQYKSYPEYGTGDTLVVSDDVEYAQNCQGGRPALLFTNDLDYPLYTFQKLGFGQSIPVPFNNSMGAGPMLVINGVINYQYSSGNYPWINQLAARTGVGFDQNRSKVYFVVVDSNSVGYVDEQSGVDIEMVNPDNLLASSGVTMPIFAMYMRDNLGLYDAMNLDGGGSSTLCSGFQCSNLMNVTSNPGGALRLLFSGLFILKK